MKKLALILALIVGASSIFAADAANDVLINQRNGANDDNVQRNVTATANALFVFDGSLIPVSTLTPTGLTSLGVNSVTAASGSALTLTGGSSGASLVLGSGAGGTGTLSINTRAVRMASASGYTGASDIVTGGAAWLFTHPTSGAYLDGLYSYTGTGSVNNLFIGARDELVFGSGGGGAADSIPDRMRLKATGNLLLNTTTDASSLTGGIVLNGSGAGAVASSTTTGTLRVTGGAGISGALYSSTVTTSGRLQVGSSLTSYIAEISESAASVTGLRAQNGSSSASAYSQLAINASGNSWGIRMGSTAANSNALEFISDITAPTVRFSMTPAGAATFSGALTAASLATAQTPGASVATASTHKVAIVLNGTTYYILLTNVP